MTPLTPLRLERLRAAQDITHDAARDLGRFSMKGLTAAQALQLSSVLDLIDRAETLLDEALEMGG